ncbi:MAG: glycosyltransferase family 2 protein, partial [Bacteroidota bacterium]
MISVCIPIYNFDVRPLVHTLHQQLLAAAVPFEIVLMDDASTQDFRQINAALESLQHCVYIQLSQNIGRAAIRNQLAQRAQYEALLFMDCDAKAPPRFIQKYMDSLREGAAVVVGGRSYSSTAPTDIRQRLRW